MPHRQKKKVAILGGGPAAITAAFWLTSNPRWHDDYEVTVYQMGWRLGGKCASGRNADENNRVEEHGLHMLAGFYENAFRTIRHAYAECALGRSPEAKKVGAFDDAFTPLKSYDNMEKFGKWLFWGFDFPANDDMPGDEARFRRRERPPDAWSYMTRILNLMTNLYEKADVQNRPALQIPQSFSFSAEVAEVLTEMGLVFASQGAIGLEKNPSFLHLAHELSHSLPTDPTQHKRSHTDALHEIAGEVLHRTKKDSVKHANEDARRLATLVNIGAAVVTGMIADGVVVHGYRQINDLDLLDWLRSNGCDYTDSAPLRSGYQACFGYEGGDTENPQFAAGSALYGALRMFDFRKGPWWQINGGTGDRIFVPLYIALRDRGVQFKFFHEVRKLSVSGDGTRIDRIDFNIQADLLGDTYDPLVKTDGTLSWPSAPRYEQLRDPEKLKGINLEAPNANGIRTLSLKRNVGSSDGFDDVILGIPIAALPAMCQDLIDHNAKWQLMVENIKTVQTQALQLWFNASSTELGYTHSQPPCATAFKAPFDTYKGTDYATGPVKHYASLCGVLKDNEGQKQVDRHAEAFLEESAKIFWPNLKPEMVRSKYARANTHPAERYTLSLPGTIRYRIRGDRSGFKNLYLVGDWTRTDLNVGCFEAAVESGMMVAQAICGHPAHIYNSPIEDDGIAETPLTFIPDQLDYFLRDQQPCYWWDWQTPEKMKDVRLPHSYSLTAGVQLEGTNLTTFLLGYVDKGTLHGLLPGQLGLEGVPWAPSGLHPIMYAFGYQREVTVPVLRWPPLDYVRTPTLSYLEMIVAVPNVLWTQHGKVRGPFCFVLDIRLDSVAAKMGGWLAGYPKTLARIEAKSDEDPSQATYVVRVPSEDQLLLEAAFSTSGQVQSLADMRPESNLISLFAQPWLTISNLGPFVETAFEMDPKKTLIQYVDADLEVSSESIPGLPPGRFHWEGAPGDAAKHAPMQMPRYKSGRMRLVPSTAFRALFQWRATANALELRVSNPFTSVQRLFSWFKA